MRVLWPSWFARSFEKDKNPLTKSLLPNDLEEDDDGEYEDQDVELRVIRVNDPSVAAHDDEDVELTVNRVNDPNVAAHDKIRLLAWLIEWQPEPLFRTMLLDNLRRARRDCPEEDVERMQWLEISGRRIADYLDAYDMTSYKLMDNPARIIKAQLNRLTEKIQGETPKSSGYIPENRISTLIIGLTGMAATATGLLGDQAVQRAAENIHTTVFKFLMKQAPSDYMVWAKIFKEVQQNYVDHLTHCDDATIAAVERIDREIKDSLEYLRCNSQPAFKPKTWEEVKLHIVTRQVVYIGKARETRNLMNTFNETLHKNYLESEGVPEELYQRLDLLLADLVIGSMWKFADMAMEKPTAGSNKRLIIINGFPGVGKTYLTKQLSAHGIHLLEPENEALKKELRAEFISRAKESMPGAEPVQLQEMLGQLTEMGQMDGTRSPFYLWEEFSFRMRQMEMWFFNMLKILFDPENKAEAFRNATFILLTNDDIEQERQDSDVAALLSRAYVIEWPALKKETKHAFTQNFNDRINQDEDCLLESMLRAEKGLPSPEKPVTEEPDVEYVLMKGKKLTKFNEARKWAAVENQRYLHRIQNFDPDPGLRNSKRCVTMLRYYLTFQYYYNDVREITQDKVDSMYREIMNIAPDEASKPEAKEELKRNPLTARRNSTDAKQERHISVNNAAHAFKVASKARIEAEEEAKRLNHERELMGKRVAQAAATKAIDINSGRKSRR